MPPEERQMASIDKALLTFLLFGVNHRFLAKSEAVYLGRAGISLIRTASLVSFLAVAEPTQVKGGPRGWDYAPMGGER
jgi:hypothetical protein